jgi:hypothetical protein
MFLLAWFSKESVMKGCSAFEISTYLGVMGSIDCMKRRFTQSKMIFTMSLGFLIARISVISAYLMDFTASSAFLR